MVLISPRNRIWRNALGYLAAVVIFPIAVVVKLVTMPLERPDDRTAAEVARYLRNFIGGTGGDWDYDDFESVPIADPCLDSIRRRAASVREPTSDEGFATLQALLAEAEALAEEDL